LEGAMGSVILNLDKWSRYYHFGPLVTIVNIPKKFRTQFFTPVKTSFDYFLLFASDLFSFDFHELNLKMNREGDLPKVNLSHSDYENLDLVLTYFKDVKVKELSSLEIDGSVNLHGFHLKGHVKIENRLKKTMDLNDCAHWEKKEKILHDCHVIIDESGLLCLAHSL
jgi:hypothetical protein